MQKPPIRLAGPGDMAALHAGLSRLSDELGDRHRATEAALAQACTAPQPAAYGFVAGDGPEGAALAAPLFSTTRGAAGLYVSDLWVAPAARGTGLGRRLLAHVARFGADRWGASFLRLSVYGENAAALAFYDRLGFADTPRDRWLVLAGAALDSLTEGTA